MAFESFTQNLLRYSNIGYVSKAIYGYSIEAAIFALIFAVSSLLCKLIGNLITKQHVKKPRGSHEAETLLLLPEDEDSEIFQESSQREFPTKELKIILKGKTHKKSFLGKLFLLAALVTKIFCFLCLAIIPSVLSSVNLISVPLSMLITFILFLPFDFFAIKEACPEDGKKFLKEKDWKDFPSNQPLFIKEAKLSYKLYPGFSTFIMTFSVFYSVVVPLLTAKSCLAYYEPQLGASFGAYDISTAFFRWLTLPQVCPEGRICHIYSTLAEDGSSSIILNVHTGLDVTNLQAAYDTHSNVQSNSALALSKEGVSIRMDVDSKGSRYIHSIYLDNLSPKTDYYVEFLHNGKVLGSANFATLPSDDMESNIVMAVGGDSGGTEKAVSFIRELANHKPDVILVGGDIVYDNGDFSCYYCWDYYLSQFDELNKKLGKLIPLILAIGNHDIGQTHFQFLGVDPYKNYFFLYFPQHTKLNNTIRQIPLPEERLSYFYHRIGNSLHVSLDSDYIAKHNEDQLTWLKATVNKYPTAAKFANYHLPIFPACFFHPKDNGFDPRTYTWVPIFEENRFISVFENHIHLFKRTFPLKMTKSGGPGVVYIGDGAWGVNPEGCYERDPNRNITGIFAELGNMNHIWIVNITKETVEYRAINTQGKVFDTYSQNINDYIL